MDKRRISQIVSVFRGVFGRGPKIVEDDNSFGDDFGPEIVINDHLSICFGDLGSLENDNLSGDGFITAIVDGDEYDEEQGHASFEDAVKRLVSLQAEFSAEYVMSGRADERTDREMLREIQRAEEWFKGTGFVGEQYFLHSWKGRGIPRNADAREASLNRLVENGSVERYSEGDKLALRTK